MEWERSFTAMQAATVTGEWRILNAYIYEPERLTHQQWVFGSDVFCRVPQQNKGKRLGFPAVWRLPP